MCTIGGKDGFESIRGQLNSDVYVYIRRDGDKLLFNDGVYSKVNSEGCNADTEESRSNLWLWIAIAVVLIIIIVVILVVVLKKGKKSTMPMK